MRSKSGFRKGVAWLGLFLLMAPLTWASSNTRATYPSAVSIEVGGKALLYSVSFDRAISESVVAGIGIGSVTANRSGIAGTSQSSVIIPAYFNYYFMPEGSSVFATGGVDLITNANSLNGLTSEAGGLKFSSSPIVPTFGVGYELRSDANFLLRVTGYGILSSSFVPWGGITFGYSF